jgi:hypothetical protein
VPATRLPAALSRAVAAAALLLAAASAPATVPASPASPAPPRAFAVDDAPCERYIRPNHTYRSDEQTFTTDARGRPVDALAPTLMSRRAPRTPCQSIVGNWPGPGDWNGGHLIAASFGGVGMRYNLVPLRGRQINQGLMKRVEDSARACLEGAGSVTAYRVRLHYPDRTTVIPDTIQMTMRTPRQVALTLPNRILSDAEVRAWEERIDAAFSCGRVSVVRR